MSDHVEQNDIANADPRSRLASVSALLEHESIKAFIAEHSRSVVLDAIRQVLDDHRRNLRSSEDVPSVGALVEEVQEVLRGEDRERLRPVVNATGIILHTGLGRAVLPQSAVDALAGLNRCVNLQMDLETGKRGKRNYATERLLTRLTEAEAAMVVANNAAATLLILTALCKDREVIISRGQLIEIGGSFRLPDCIHQSGARMVEVGTTNKTHLRDYENAFTEETGMVMRCNPSNYRIRGFTQSVSTAKLATLKKKHPFILVDDLGCGALVNLEDFGLPREPMVADSVRAGADLVCFSGDKLIGGPQAGIIVGRRELIARIRKHPLTRMLRVGKLTDLALEHTLRLFLTPEKLAESNPTYRMLSIPVSELKRRAARLKKAAERRGLPFDVEVQKAESATGGGSLPGTPIETIVLALSSSRFSADALSRELRRSEPPVIARISNDRVMLDMRTLMDGDDEHILRALEAISEARPDSTDSRA